MAEWIGRLIVGWPIWLVVVTVLLIGLAWFLYTSGLGRNGAIGKQEWWQDRQKRLEKEAAARQSKMKAKKG